jgi:hypothetical protein
MKVAIMLRSPQNNGDRVSVSTRRDFRMVMEAYNFHAESIGSQRTIMRRLGPDNVLVGLSAEERDRIPRSLIDELERDMRPA